MSHSHTIIESRRATFRAATRGLHSYRLAKALNKLRPGYDWRGCGKNAMRDEFSSGLLAEVSGQKLRAAIAALSDEVAP